MFVGIPAAVVIGVNVVTGATLKQWSAGETLKADDLNANFAALNSSVVEVSGDQTIGGNKTFSNAIVAPPTYAVASTTTAFTTTSTTFVALTGLSATITTHGKPVLITVNTNFNAQAVGANATAWAALTVNRGSTNLGNASLGIQIAEEEVGRNDPMSLSFVDVPAAGQHTYTVQVRAGGTGMTVEFGEGGQTQQLTVTELN